MPSAFTVHVFLGDRINKPNIRRLEIEKVGNVGTSFLIVQEVHILYRHAVANDVATLHNTGIPI